MATTYTYDDNAIREDLLGVITNLDFKESQLIDTLGTADADAVLHQWLKDTLKTVGVNAKVEGADSTYAARTNPTRLTNYCQIIEQAYQVSESDRASNTAGFNDRKTYEAEKAMKEWKQDAEFALMRGTLACGTGSAARTLKGMKAWLNNTTAQSGVSLTETILNDYFEEVWDDGVEVDTVYAPIYLKRKIAGFVGAATEKNVSADDRRLVNAVDIYQSDAAQNVRLYKHRYVGQPSLGDTNYDIVGVKRDFFKVAYLRRPKTEDLAKTGDSDKSRVVAELTLECYHDDAGFVATAHL